MRPAFSVILLTTLTGCGQGLFLALYVGELAARAGLAPAASARHLALAGALALVLAAGGLVASIFHLGRPLKAWRAVACWRTSWLSREVIVLPLFMLGLLLWIVAQHRGGAHAMPIGALTALAAIALYVCTGMIYAALTMIREWATPLTPISYLLLGSASGTLLAAACAAWEGARLAAPMAAAAVVLAVLGAVVRMVTLARNRSLRSRSTLQSAIGIAHPRITQRSQGAMGGSFNTREFFHGASPQVMRSVRVAFPLLAFALPIALVVVDRTSASLLTAAFLIQFAGLVAERWYFFADVVHPQNLYYQTIS